MLNKKPKAFVLDVDGVMTDGRFYYNTEGKVIKIFGPDDHDALTLLKPYIEIRFVSGDSRGFPISKSRIVDDMKMPLELVSTTKRIDWIKERWEPDEVIYMGDGIFDHYVFREVGYGISVKNADALTKKYADYITKRAGGDRAVAEACLHVFEKFFAASNPDASPHLKTKLTGKWSRLTQQKLKGFVAKRRCTLLCVGPMSKNCVDATIELANEYEVPLPIIASRRQIEADTFGGGYVNNWTTESFAEYVREKDKKDQILLARDHGGPWQNEFEKKEKLGLRKAMEIAKESFKVDIESGFDIIHIDPSIDCFAKPSVDEILDRILELYEFCWTVAQQNNREILFEIGTEEQTGSTNMVEELEYILSKMVRLCRINDLPMPIFMVVQIGTRVMETRNIGSFDSPFRIANELPAEIQVPKMVEVCNKYNVFMKTHNTDYLSDEALYWHPKLGIHSSNVAPEFGVTETKAFLQLLERYKLLDLTEEFIQLSCDSKKWDKWILPGSKANKREKAIIAGHYVFASPEFNKIKQAAQGKLKKHKIDVDTHLKDCVKQSILRYMNLFRLLRLS